MNPSGQEYNWLMGVKLVYVDKDDVLRALKKFKGIAKQDLLIQDDHPLSQVFKKQAEARRAVYGRLIEITETDGVDKAYQYAVREYLRLPPIESNVSTDPETVGTETALELAIQVFGLAPKGIAALRIARRTQRTLINRKSAESAS